MVVFDTRISFHWSNITTTFSQKVHLSFKHTCNTKSEALRHDKTRVSQQHFFYGHFITFPYKTLILSCDDCYLLALTLYSFLHLTISVRTSSCLSCVSLLAMNHSTAKNVVQNAKSSALISDVFFFLFPPNFDIYLVLSSNQRFSISLCIIYCFLSTHLPHFSLRLLYL